jgi:hypothetical protein
MIYASEFEATHFWLVRRKTAGFRYYMSVCLWETSFALIAFSILIHKNTN